MEILLWLVPPVVVTLVAMAWVGWVGREGRGEVDRDEAVRRLGAALEREQPPRPARLPRRRERSTGVAVRRTPRTVARRGGRARRRRAASRRLTRDRRGYQPFERVWLMNQRVLAAFLAMPLVAALAVVALFKPLPYTTYAPGPTIDVLGAPDGKEIIQVPSGQKTYRDDGQLRMTTVSVTPKDSNLNLFQVMGGWLDRDDAVYPKEAVYPDDKTPDQVRDEGQVQMVSSQDTAVAVALRALGETVTPSLEVTLISPGSPADGALAVRDLIRKVNGTPLSDDIGKASDELRAAIKSTPPGEQVTLTVLRDGKEVDVQVTPEERSADLFGAVTVTGSPQIGIHLGQGFILPFPVTVTIDPRIGGPSAGLMFSLAIYDTLTPGSLTGGGRVAGTGEIAPDGTVGAIGGIQQKIVGAREDGAELFLVPADNCEDAKGAHNGDMRLVRVDTFDTAKSAVEAWAEDHDAELPSCS